MKKLLYILFIFATAFLTSCELIDPTEVENPAITEDKLFEDATGGAAPLIVGLQYSFSDALMKTITYTEVTSDNYDNTNTFLSNIIDNPRDILPNETQLDDTREIYFELQTIHAKALFGIEVILPKDANATSDDYSEVYFYKGMALLMLSENFSAFPIKEGGIMVKSEEALTIAINDLKQSIDYNGSSDNISRCYLALARAYRLLGDKNSAFDYASLAIATNSNFLFAAQYDAANLDNELYTFTVARANTNDMQPLPSLDFLDPKYPDEVSEIPALKSEEAYLILSEIALANNDLASAKEQLKNTLTLVKNRSIVEFNDRDPRTDRPNDNSCIVVFNNSSIQYSGLIKKRSNNPVQIGIVSNTSITEQNINDLANITDAFELLYKMRQEVFFCEGRRMSDLGIRLPVMQTQIDANSNINNGDYGTSVIVPSYIPFGYGLDEFSYDDNSKIVTIQYNMNQIIALNISTASPFL